MVHSASLCKKSFCTVLLLFTQTHLGNGESLYILATCYVSILQQHSHCFLNVRNEVSFWTLNKMFKFLIWCIFSVCCRLIWTFEDTDGFFPLLCFLQGVVNTRIRYFYNEMCLLKICLFRGLTDAVDDAEQAKMFHPMFHLTSDGNVLRIVVIFPVT